MCVCVGGGGGGGEISLPTRLCKPGHVTYSIKMSYKLFLTDSRVLQMFCIVERSSRPFIASASCTEMFRFCSARFRTCMSENDDHVNLWND